MSFKNKKLIEELYENKSFSILHVAITQHEYLAFVYPDFELLTSLLKSENISIRSIELYSKDTYKITQPSFWYNKDNSKECFDLIKKFLGTLIDCNDQVYAVEIKSDTPQSLLLKNSLDKISTLKAPLYKS